MVQTTNHIPISKEKCWHVFLSVTQRANRNLWESVTGTTQSMISNFYLSPKPTLIFLFSKLGSTLRQRWKLVKHYDLYSLCVLTTTCYLMSSILWVVCLVRCLTLHCSFMVNCLLEVKDRSAVWEFFFWFTNDIRFVVRLLNIPEYHIAYNYCLIATQIPFRIAQLYLLYGFDSLKAISF